MRDLVVILHNVRSIHNVGSIFRTAEAAGAKKIYLAGFTPSPVDRVGALRSQFRKVSLGAERTLPWEKISNVNGLMQKLREKQNYRVYAVEQTDRSKPYYELRRVPRRCALILGNEVRGIPRSVWKNADEVMDIPLQGKKESLNVSVAAGIALFHFLHAGESGIPAHRGV
ncbi:MAG: TrmH family RNA methyltransferase [Candidatus Liptonbacteria bacterium]|nr:TrmH family RNA methyltransferase [Candidatus Liptonbacteria bacterium]